MTSDFPVEIPAHTAWIPVSCCETSTYAGVTGARVGMRVEIGVNGFLWVLFLWRSTPVTSRHAGVTQFTQATCWEQSIFLAVRAHLWCS